MRRVRVHLLLPGKLLRALDSTARKRGVSRSEEARRLLEMALAIPRRGPLNQAQDSP